MAVYNTGFRWNATGYTQIDLADILVPREQFSDGNLVTWSGTGYSGTYATTNGDPLSGNTWVSADAGVFGTVIVAVKSDGTLWGWGYNNNGELGNSSAAGTFYSVPTQISATNNWKSAIAADQYCLFLRQDGTLWWSGRDRYGEAGGAITPVGFRSSPLQIQHPLGKSWKTVASKYLSVYALDSEGALYSWGYGSYGALGLNSPQYVSTPTQVGTEKNWVKIAAGLFAGMGIKSDGTLWTWGEAIYGGRNSTTHVSSPVQIYQGGTWLDAQFCYNGGAGIKTDGTLWTWGGNYAGNLGSDASGSRYYPGKVGLETTWKKVIGGAYAPGAIKQDGTLWGWGISRKGIGNGTTNYSSPIQVNIGGTNWKDANGASAPGMFALRDSSLPNYKNNSGYVTTATSGIFTVPAGVTSVTIVACGGGGCGGAGSSRQFGQYSGGSGGGSGELRSVTTAVTPGQTITYEIGTGGGGAGARDGPYSGGSAGTNGGTSRASINGGATWIVVANGGVAGTISQITSSLAGGAGGSGGTGTVVAASAAGGNGIYTNLGKTGDCRGGDGARGFLNYTGSLGSAGTGAIGLAYSNPLRMAVSGTGYGAGGSGGGCNYASNDSYYNATRGNDGFIYIYW